MRWSAVHASALAQAFEKVLGAPESGSTAFVRCLSGEAVRALAEDDTFAPTGWTVSRIADRESGEKRTIAADRAVEMREEKGDAVLFLVDAAQAGAGMDGIYSAAREVREAELFQQASRLAAGEVTRRLSRESRLWAERAVRESRGRGAAVGVSPWVEFDFLCRIAADARPPGACLHQVGLWPVLESRSSEGSNAADDLAVSRLFMDRLFGPAVSGLSPAKRIDSLRLLGPSEKQLADLERFLLKAAAQPLLPALAGLAEKEHLWVNALRIETSASEIQEIELTPWRAANGKIAKWSGLKAGGDESEDPPVFILDPEAVGKNRYSTLEVRWKARPANLEKDAAQYRIAVVTDQQEELAFGQVSHSARREEKVRFGNDDFTELSEDALIAAKVVVSVIGVETVEPRESEEFLIRIGEAPEDESTGIGKPVRTFSEGLIELEDRKAVSTTVASRGSLLAAENAVRADAKGFLSWRTAKPRKSFRVFQPPLIREVEEQWAAEQGRIGRWRVKARASGECAGAAEFIPFDRPQAAPAAESWDRAADASRRMAERFAVSGGGAGQVYDDKEARTFVEYLRTWGKLLEDGGPRLALANTVEVQSLSGRTIGLIVLPSHPLRMAWLAAYDNLLLHTAFDGGKNAAPKPREILQECAALDGAMFPAMLPGPDGGTSFVFADTLGFHAAGMVLDSEKAPKAAAAILSRALHGTADESAAPTAGESVSGALAKEVAAYMGQRGAPRLLRVHAIKAGDGLTAVRALGAARKRFMGAADGEDAEETDEGSAPPPAFALEFYSPSGQRAAAGRFIAEAQEKRRRGAGVLPEKDRWMLESLGLPGGVNLPALRWARKDEPYPRKAAHLALAFDLLEPRVVAGAAANGAGEKPADPPLHAFGLLACLRKEYVREPLPTWRAAVPLAAKGEKHPSERAHSERLMRLQRAVQKAVAGNLDPAAEQALLQTRIGQEEADNLNRLHRLCDRVITLGRSAGVEYFDSPRGDREIYDNHAVDCLPQLGGMQWVVSTGNIEEIRGAAADALRRIGMSAGRAGLLVEQLRALSGRLCLRLTAPERPVADLVALAFGRAHCRQGSDEACWPPLEDGFLIPLDDIADMLPPLEAQPGAGLLHVSAAPRKGLRFCFIKAKYRRHLREARDPEMLQEIRRQLTALRRPWDKWRGGKDVCAAFRAVRRAKLARVLHFYVEKARRHGLAQEQYAFLAAEIDRMIEKGGAYEFEARRGADRGWVFCPEYSGGDPLRIAPEGDGSIFLFGPGRID